MEFVLQGDMIFLPNEIEAIWIVVPMNKRKILIGGTYIDRQIQTAMTGSFWNRV